MSQHQFFKRAPGPPQLQQQLQALTIPAPSRGIIMDENEAFMQPGGALICDNWKPTLRGVSLRAGCVAYCTLPEATPIISGFRYAAGSNQKIFAGNATKLYDVTAASPVLVKSGQGDGNYSASQLSNQGGDFLVAVNDSGDFPLSFDGTTWSPLTADEINGPPGSNVQHGKNLTQVCKYRNRWFFIEASSMNAWYLPLNAKQGLLSMIPLSGAATEGGKLLFCAPWSIDAGDGIDDKLVFCTDLGEILVFTGSDPSSSSNWRQEGRYHISPPMGKNAWMQLGGDLLIATTSGIIPISAAINKTPEELELAAITRSIKPMWRDEVNAKRAWSWTMMNWEEYGGIFVTWPGGVVGNRLCAVVNAASGAWARYVGYDATCFMQMRADMFFGTQTGKIMQADRTGKDDGLPYVATVVGGWEMFQAPSQTVTWRQARAVFKAGPGQPFTPQLSALVDFDDTALPSPPPAGLDFAISEGWDEGHWDVAKWDADVSTKQSTRNTGWVSIGATGFTHAPVVQVTVAQSAKPDVDLVAIAATYERGAVNV